MFAIWVVYVGEEKRYLVVNLENRKVMSTWSKHAPALRIVSMLNRAIGDKAV